LHSPDALRDGRIKDLRSSDSLAAQGHLGATARSPAQDRGGSGLNIEVDALGEVVAQHFGRHPDAEIYASQPGLGVILGARVLAEFGDDAHRYADARARKNYAGTSPITRASGTKKIVIARYAKNDRLADALQQWAFGSMRGSSGARAYYDAMRARKIGHQAALRQLANRHVGILHGCLKTRTLYNETTA
jgi:transposase